MNPTVMAVMLANGRPEMVRRAVRCFRTQSYARKRLLIWDTGELNQDLDTTGEGNGEIVHIPAEAYREPLPTIGELRNEANVFARDVDIICHWDSDDWSHPRRIEEQIALLEASTDECVGYRDMLFWRSPLTHITPGKPTDTKLGEAWLYTNNDQRYCLGTSLCYWRSVWESRPFPDLPKTFTRGRLAGKSSGNAEDLEWLHGVKSLGISSLVAPRLQDNDLPRMIACIHASNTQDYSGIENSPNNWRGVPEWDDYCRERMAL